MDKDVHYTMHLPQQERDMIDLVAEVRKHAISNYEKGWDVVVEAWDDKDIIEAMGSARTVSGAIKKVGKVVAAYNDYADDIRASAF